MVAATLVGGDHPIGNSTCYKTKW